MTLGRGWLSPSLLVVGLGKSLSEREVDLILRFSSELQPTNPLLSLSLSLSLRTHYQDVGPSDTHLARLQNETLTHPSLTTLQLEPRGMNAMVRE